MKVAIIQGHPDGDGAHLCHALADAYRNGALDGGHDVRTIALAKLDFPWLRTKDAFERGALPEALSDAQATIAWADHVLLVYPLWLGEMPALVKAFLEQVLRPGFAFTVTGTGWRPRLRGKSARVVVTMGMPALVYRWYFGAHGLKSLRRNVLSFVGFKPVRATLLGGVEGASAKRRAAWLARLAKLGSAAA
jgi:putative NADPH-quinone reductase